MGAAREPRRRSGPAQYSTQSDNELVVATREGDRSAYAELWRRHSRAAISVARSYTSFDADDVVAEAFANIYTTIGRGGGPTGGFRPYLFTTVRNVAAQWGRAANTLNVEDIETIGDMSNEADTLDRLEKSLAATAFRSLPNSWQEVLWYSEVESLTPRQIAPLLGLSPNSVSALAMRAREGLRVAWVKAHLSSASADPECSWTIERLPAWSRGGVTQRTKTRIDAHLESCVDCRAAADEAEHMNGRLAVILLPLAAGVAGAAAYIRTVGSNSPMAPVAIATVGGVSVSGTGIAVVAGLLAAALVVAVCLVPSSGGTAVAGTERLHAPAQVPTSSAPPEGTGSTEPAPPMMTTSPDADDSLDPAAVPPAAGMQAEPAEATSAPAEDPQASVLDAPSIESSSRPMIVYPAVHGTAAPHAVVALAANGVADEWTTTADAAGSWEAELTGLTPGTWSVTASQSVTDTSDVRHSERSREVVVELLDAPQAVNGAVSSSPHDGSISGEAGASYVYTLVLATGQIAESILILDADGNGWVPIPRDDEVESIAVHYVFGDWRGPINVIVPPFR
ncbi:sigma-70 family RNA polymerase sigma factor [Agreia sp. PsM10]|uniref:sigma-70 family RNA polymerase sigma factor n=1 Tax=Agreia sp. PsM10 TaxID=3030533 RepID=UPI00263BA7E7|nr:sigma-70 family RNA polymerase sigma factor [Agreia sp. PsM10]MDN4641449.1 sigma-70 family RNA polymerase sigma factor [Agreia sp. PsM10]